jgi:uncharacterized protein DUF3182
MKSVRGKKRSKVDGAVVFFIDAESDPSIHERRVHEEIAGKVAALKEYRFAGVHERVSHFRCTLYFVPIRTLTADDAVRLGIQSEADLFGGVVPFPLVGTKVITHPLVENCAATPGGWSHDFPDAVQQVTLPGFSVFSRADAVRAGRLLLEQGRARIKPARGVGGRGQTVVSNAQELDTALAAIEDAELATHGVVVESNLRNVTTFSVGQVRVADLVASYYGTQRLTKDNQGRDVYGGSDLIVARGDYDALLNLALAPEARLAVTQARVYDEAASTCFPGLIASRRNYDVAQGLDANDEPRSGVLEQSWRIGGASAAEVAALEAFRADPALDFVRACCVEKYGLHEPPEKAVLQFRGMDNRVGAITRYTVVDPYGDSEPKNIYSCR